MEIMPQTAVHCQVGNKHSQFEVQAAVAEFIEYNNGFRFFGLSSMPLNTDIDDGSGGTINPTLHAFMVGFHRSF